MGFISSDRSQMDLFGYSINDFAKTDKKCRFVVDIVSQLDLSELFARYSDQGADSYAPDIMLATWFYSYSHTVTSSRKIEDLCKFDTRYMYISCNQHPDHTTLSRFRKKNIDLICKYFIQIVLIAQQQGLSDFKHIAIDGTKVNAATNSKHSYTEDELTEKIEAIRKDIVHYMQRCDFVEQGTTDELDLEILRAEKQRLEELEEKLLQRKEQLQQRKKTLKPEHQSKHRINIIEPDARLMPKALDLNYNGQAAVDVASHLIVAVDAVDKPNDQGQFIPIYNKIETTIGSDPDRSYIADAGYHNLDDLEYIGKNKINAIIADTAIQNRSTRSKPTSREKLLKEKRKIERSDFTYHQEEDYYECPSGNRLTPVENKGDKTVYRASGCNECPLSIYCLSSKKKVKQIHRSHREAYAEQMANKLQNPSAREFMLMRKISVEPVFGNLKHNLGFNRFSLRGLANVKGEFTLMAIAHNLNIMYKWMHKKRFATLIDASLCTIKQHIAMSKNFMTTLISNVVSNFKFKIQYV
jgi:transposase